jgi:hypothetical protein
VARLSSHSRPYHCDRLAQPSGRALSREATAMQATPKPYLSQLARRLPTPLSPDDASPKAVADYTELLDRVLEDRVVTEAELAELARLAQEWNLGQEQLASINLSCMRGLASSALADEVITRAERYDLERLRCPGRREAPAALVLRALHAASLRRQAVIAAPLIHWTVSGLFPEPRNTVMAASPALLRSMTSRFGNASISAGSMNPASAQP